MLVAPTGAEPCAMSPRKSGVTVGKRKASARTFRLCVRKCPGRCRGGNGPSEERPKQDPKPTASQPILAIGFCLRRVHKVSDFHKGKGGGRWTQPQAKGPKQRGLPRNEGGSFARGEG